MPETVYRVTHSGKPPWHVRETAYPDIGFRLVSNAAPRLFKLVDAKSGADVSFYNTHLRSREDLLEELSREWFVKCVLEHIEEDREREREYRERSRRYSR